MSRFYRPFIKGRRAIVQVFQDRNIGHGGETARLVASGAVEMVVDSVPSVTQPRSAAHHWRLIVCVLLPFAAGFYLSYLLRTINALISTELTSDLALNPAALGLVTSVYFLTMAALQVPVGVWLDRYGPRRVQSAFMLVAAAGAALFAVANSLSTLVLARLLIGIGFAPALMAGLKAIVSWFPKERIALANGCMVMLGTLGALTATAPAELLLQWTGWRGMFELLAAATAACAALTYFIVPERRVTAPARGSASVNLRSIFRDPRFWRLAPLSATCIGTAWALLGLWAAQWLTDVERLDRAGVIRHLLVMTVALSAGALLLGTTADRLRRHGVRPQTILAVVVALFITAQLALILRLPLPSYLLWSMVAAVGGANVLGYAILAEYFPNEAIGRANGALNVFQLTGAFALQYAPGLVIGQWTSEAGHYPAVAYQTAFGLGVALQIAALAWFVQSRAFGRWSILLPVDVSDSLEPPRCSEQGGEILGHVARQESTVENEEDRKDERLYG
jgi:MFS family permease